MLRLIANGLIVVGVLSLSAAQVQGAEPPTVEQVKKAFRETIRASGYMVGETTNAVIDREVPRVAQAIEDMQNVQVFVDKTSGVENGFCYALYSNNQVQRSGYYRDGKRIGPWRFYFPDGSLSVKLQYDDDGKQVGQHVRYSRNGNIHYVEVYVNGVKHGPKTTFYDDGTTHMHQMWQNGQMEGVSIIYYGNGAIKKFATWARGRQHGLVIRYDEAGNITEQATYVDGQKQ